MLELLIDLGNCLESTFYDDPKKAFEDFNKARKRSINVYLELNSSSSNILRSGRRFNGKAK